jgi:Mg-chelatase subunit ChlD
MPFSHYLHTKKFLSKGDDIQLIKDYINALDAGGTTSLYSAMENIYTSKIKNSLTTTNTVIFTITDGENNAGISSNDGIIKLAKDLRDISPQSVMPHIHKVFLKI